VRRPLTAAVTIAAAAITSASTPAAGARSVPDASRDAAVRELRLDDRVRAVDLDTSVIELRTEEHRGGETVVTINADVLFAFDSAELTGVARREIAAVAARLTTRTASTEQATPILVDGYTDSFGTPAYNVILSQRRASAVADALRPAAPDGVLVSATGHGSADPIARNTAPDGSDDPAGRARNRRVTITYAGG
jgi:outer membrane protein OmpA-like peptidoglycan-associated protein